MERLKIQAGLSFYTGQSHDKSYFAATVTVQWIRDHTIVNVLECDTAELVYIPLRFVEKESFLLLMIKSLLVPIRPWRSFRGRSSVCAAASEWGHPSMLQLPREVILSALQLPREVIRLRCSFRARSSIHVAASEGYIGLREAAWWHHAPGRNAASAGLVIGSHCDNIYILLLIRTNYHISYEIHLS